MKRAVTFPDQNILSVICGANDANIPYLENLLDTTIYLRGDSLIYDGDDKNTEELFILLLKKLEDLAASRSPVTQSEIFMEYQSLLSLGPISELAETSLSDDSASFAINLGKRSVFPKNSTQKIYLKALSESQICFAIGPSGTGKTFLAVAHSLAQIISGKKQKLILSRPVVEAGESLGYLPGDLAQKLNPYLKPLFDSMEFMISPQMIKRLFDSSMIEIAPLAYMRGRNLHHACIILDEAQNTTIEQMKMFLTRLGEDSAAIVTGDVTQTDLPKNRVSGLVHAASILLGIEGISFVHFHSKDVVRSRIVQRIVDAYEKNK